MAVAGDGGAPRRGADAGRGAGRARRRPRRSTRRWDGRDRWTRFEYAGARVVRAVVDPRGKIAIDIEPGEQRVDRADRPRPPRGHQVGGALDVLAPEPAGAPHGGGLMLGALRDGFRALGRNWGLVLLVLAREPRPGPRPRPAAGGAARGRPGPHRRLELDDVRVRLRLVERVVGGAGGPLEHLPARHLRDRLRLQEPRPAPPGRAPRRACSREAGREERQRLERGRPSPPPRPADPGRGRALPARPGLPDRRPPGGPPRAAGGLDRPRARSTARASTSAGSSA